MNTLYILGGPPRIAKTTIMSGIASNKTIPFITADAVEHGIRNVLTGEPHQMLRHVELSGSAEYKATITDGGQVKTFSKSGNESELTLQAVLGMLDYYGRNDQSVAVEGALFTPQTVHDLSVPNFAIKAAFVGFTNPNQADQIIAFARANPHDWINEWLRNDNHDETKLREWVTKQAHVSKKLKSDAEKLGYQFFDISTMSFEQYQTAVQHAYK